MYNTIIIISLLISTLLLCNKYKNHRVISFVNLIINKIIDKIIKTLQCFLTFAYKKFVTISRNYLIEILKNEELNNSLQMMLNNQLNTLISSENIKNQLVTSLKDTAHRLSTDDEMSKYIHSIILDQLRSTNSSPETRTAVANLLKTQIEGMTKEEWFIVEVKDQITNIATNTCESVEVKDKLRELLEKLMGDLIDSGQLNKKLNDLMTQVINDEDLIKGVGSGIRRTARHAVYGIFWGDSRPETKDKDKLDNSDSKSELKPDTVAKQENQENNKFDHKHKKIQIPSTDTLKVAIVPKQRSDSLSNSLVKLDSSIVSQT